MPDFSLPPSAPHGWLDWRESTELPRRKDIDGGYFRRRSKSVSLLAVHHAAGAGSVKAINTFHTDTGYFKGENAPHIAYHFYIERSGMVYWCNHLWERGWHASDANDEAIGICLEGNLSTSSPTQAQLSSLQWLTRELRAYYGLKVDQVRGHGELTAYNNSTSCPGTRLLRLVKAYRAGTPFAELATPPVPATPEYEQLGGFVGKAGAGNVPTGGAYETEATIQYQEHSKADMLYLVETLRVFREVK